MRWVGRALAIAGAAAIVWSVTSRAWWSYVGGSELFDDMTGRLGPYHGTWCSGVFCHDFHMSRAGGAFDKLGVVAFWAGLVAAAAIVMATLASRARVRAFAYAAIGSAAVAAAAGAGAVVTRGLFASHFEMQPGYIVLAVGAAVAAAGCVMLARGGGVTWRARPRVGHGLVIAACVLAFVSIAGHDFWHWHWFDEDNRVGLASTERCWVYPDRTSCSHVESVAEIFMQDKEDPPRFAKLADHTYQTGLAVILLAVLVLVAAKVAPKLAPSRDVRPAPWVVLLLLSIATLALTPDLGTSRDVHLGYAFPLLWLACALGIAGSSLSTSTTTPVSEASDSPPLT